MSSALSANNPTPPTSDPATEDIVSHSYGLFANTLEELFADYVQQRNNLIGVFNIKADLYNQLVPFNTAYKVSLFPGVLPRHSAVRRICLLTWA